MDEDTAGYQRWISRKEIKSAKILRTKDYCKDYCKAYRNNVYCFFMTIFTDGHTSPQRVPSRSRIPIVGRSIPQYLGTPVTCGALVR